MILTRLTEPEHKAVRAALTGELREAFDRGRVRERELPVVGSGPHRAVFVTVLCRIPPTRRRRVEEWAARHLVAHGMTPVRMVRTVRTEEPLYTLEAALGALA